MHILTSTIRPQYSERSTKQHSCQPLHKEVLQPHTVNNHGMADVTPESKVISGDILHFKWKLHVSPRP
ncbi:hypothetical protein HKD37_10G027399 [Glycine soja]|uniref:Uncharacterized protein n=1 Tax=Glycine max TaxID=3847 RepID=K7LHM2_SOYBN|nr:hypothetical protein JHK86_027130 [Glycine max]